MIDVFRHVDENERLKLVSLSFCFKLLECTSTFQYIKVSLKQTTNVFIYSLWQNPHLLRRNKYVWF